MNETKVTLTELHKNTSNVVQDVITNGKKVMVTDHGRDVAQIVPVRPINRKRILQALSQLEGVVLAKRV